MVGEQKPQPAQQEEQPVDLSQASTEGSPFVVDSATMLNTGKRDDGTEPAVEAGTGTTTATANTQDAAVDHSLFQPVTVGAGVNSDGTLQENPLATVDAPTITQDQTPERYELDPEIVDPFVDSSFSLEFLQKDNPGRQPEIQKTVLPFARGERIQSEFFVTQETTTETAAFLHTQEFHVSEVCLKASEYTTQHYAGLSVNAEAALIEETTTAMFVNPITIVNPAVRNRLALDIDAQQILPENFRDLVYTYIVHNSPSTAREWHPDPATTKNLMRVAEMEKAKFARNGTAVTLTPDRLNQTVSPARATELLATVG